VASGVDSTYIPPQRGTQCAMPGDEAAWHAACTFKINGILRNVDIGEPGFGLSKAGSHPAFPSDVDRRQCRRPQ